MSGVQVSLDVRGLEPVLRVLAAAALAGKDLAPPLRSAGKTLVDHARLRFTVGRGPDGVPWVPSHRALRENGQTGRDSGMLMRSLTYRVPGPGELVYGTSKVYGAPFQFGADIPPHTIRPKRKKALAWAGGRHPVKVVRHPGAKNPPRPFVGLSGDDRDDLRVIFTRHLAGRIGPAGGGAIGGGR